MAYIHGLSVRYECYCKHEDVYLNFRNVKTSAIKVNDSKLNIIIISLSNRKSMCKFSKIKTIKACMNLGINLYYTVDFFRNITKIDFKLI